jgi:hypothetical protein
MADARAGCSSAVSNRDARADADAHENGALDALVVANAEHVRHHIREGERRIGLVGQTVAAQVDRDDSKEGRITGDLIEPQAPVEGIGVRQHHGRAVAMNLVVDAQAIVR